ncbi:hypothetical protein OCU04_006217 [Sclerotinia nivalis]|uniref:Uncharacterized protein n=1 Tax=Sclerotinia nivalis TaxID=352851 RepID=A0A9X0DL01_9HELO|nr:hypothetical protein OCU04_006217 [Sclerotinia nivalis]
MTFHFFSTIRMLPKLNSVRNMGKFRGHSMFATRIFGDGMGVLGKIDILCTSNLSSGEKLDRSFMKSHLVGQHFSSEVDLLNTCSFFNQYKLIL